MHVSNNLVMREGVVLVQKQMHIYRRGGGCA
jgi:hypothetical protein